MTSKMISRIFGETFTPGEPQRQPHTKFPIALLCSQSADGECFARPFPLWKILSKAFDLSSRDSMLNALIQAQALFAHDGDPLGINDADAFATASENRRVFVIACPDAHLGREAIEQALSSIPDDFSPGPIVSLGAGESAALARNVKLSEIPEMAAYLDRLSDIGHSVQALGFSASMPNVIAHASARAEAENLAELAFRLQEKRKYLPQHTGENNPFLTISYSSNYSMDGVMSAMPTFADRTLVIPLPSGLVGSWRSTAPKSEIEANALLERIKRAVARAQGKCLSEAGSLAKFWGESSQPLVDSMRIDCSNGRWVISGHVETSYFFAKDGDSLDQIMVAGGAALGSRIADNFISIDAQWPRPWLELGKIGADVPPSAPKALSDLSKTDRASLLALVEQADISLSAGAPSGQAARSQTL